VRGNCEIPLFSSPKFDDFFELFFRLLSKRNFTGPALFFQSKEVKITNKNRHFLHFTARLIGFQDYLCVCSFIPSNREGMMILLHSLSLKSKPPQAQIYPFNLPLVKGFVKLKFQSPVTFLVGENGSGKSTLLEAIAAGINAVTVGAEDVERDKTLSPARRLGKIFKFAWSKRTARGFFLRAEDFFGFAKRVSRLMEEMEELAEEFEGKFTGTALSLAKGSALSQKYALVEKYGENLDANSHGESFLKLFQARFVPGGLYLLDEPEAPLSPLRQLSFLSMLKEMVNQDAQFIIATHSPILMAFPQATIYSFDSTPIKAVTYDEIEHVTLTKAFLNNPESFLRHL
jgi:predicted ATPase